MNFTDWFSNEDSSYDLNIEWVWYLKIKKKICQSRFFKFQFYAVNVIAIFSENTFQRSKSFLNRWFDDRLTLVLDAVFK